MCEKCKIIRRHGAVLVICSEPASQAATGVDDGTNRRHQHPAEQAVEVGLTYIYGVGPSQRGKMLAEAGVDPNTYVRDLTEDEVRKLRDAIDQNLTVEGDLRRERSQNIKRLMEIGCYRGLRHRRGLPVDGQRTKTNARTRKGPKRMQVAGKKKVKK